MAKLVFDIETAGEDFDSLDETTQKTLTRWVSQSYIEGSPEYEKAIEKVKMETVFSPATSQIVAIGILDCDKDRGVVYFQAPGEKMGAFEEDGIEFKPTTEKEMLERFWYGVKEYDELISFAGRTFDVPFILIRSAVHGIRATKDLMSNRYLGSQKFGALHVDLLDQLSFYGAFRRQTLHAFTRAFGIKSPKASGVSGDNVTELFNEKKYKDIARYNARDLHATKELYEYWNAYIRF